MLLISAQQKWKNVIVIPRSFIPPPLFCSLRPANPIRLQMDAQILKEPLSFFFFFLILVLAEVRQAPATVPGFQGCTTVTCGDVLIKYPFWKNGQQPAYCGYPLLNITCTSNNSTQIPLIHVGSSRFYIKNIFYEKQLVQLTDALYMDNTCPLPHINHTTLIFPFNLSPQNKQIFFLYNCSGSMNHGYRNISCAPEGPAVFGGEYNGPDQLNFSTSSCGLVVVPVLESSKEALKGDYIELLRTGWLLNWTLPDCTQCHDSGGQCGYNESTASFMCICHDRIHLKTCNNRRSNEKFIIAVVAASAGLITVPCALGGFFFYMRKRRQQRSTSESDTEMDGHLQTQIFSYDELKEATDCFNSSRELGDGGFGTVYKGKLRDGRTVAVKRLYSSNYKRLELFMNEVEILSRLRHQNLVTLYGCTSQRSHELLLVYEFISNGTVADHLNGSRASEHILTWPMRLNIAIETADALAYLHAVDPPIIHRDVKTSNILLDCSFHVKVGDFGLSRLFPSNATHVSTTPQGTPGYVDPEYHQYFQLTEKSDVYSFGVVLVELISSMPAVDISRERSEIKLANMAITKIQNHELDDLVDRGIWCQSDAVTKMMITMVAELAVRCLQPDGDMRPSMREVFEGLSAIESSAGKSDEKVKNDVLTQDELGLLKDMNQFSPDSVTGKWSLHHLTSMNKSNF